MKKPKPSNPAAAHLFVLAECTVNLNYVQSIMREFDLEGAERGVRILMGSGEVIYSETPYDIIQESLEARAGE